MSRRVRGTLAAVWGVGGFIALLLFAVVRLSAIAWDAFAYAWHWQHYLVFVVNIAFMAWSEGYRGFHASYSPRLASRAHYLSRRATPLQALLAPLACMGFAWAPRRRIVAAWLLTAAIVAVVLVYRALPQPWRGILDAGVVVGLAAGVASTLYWVERVFRREPHAIDPEFGTAAALGE